MICASFVWAQSLKAQDEAIKGRLFYAELGGPGVITSINFDSRFKTGERLGLGYRVGVGFGIHTFDEYDESDENGYYNSVYHTKSYYSIPVGLNYVLGKKKSANAFEIGAGASFLTRKVSLYYYDNNEKPGHFIGHISFMYRRVPVNGGFTFRIGFTPIIGTSGDLFPMGAIGFGYSF
jgi:hypothetical protein